MGIKLCDLGLGNSFLGTTLKAQVTKEKQINWTSSKLKLCVFKKFYQGSENTTHKIGENVFK